MFEYRLIRMLAGDRYADGKFHIQDINSSSVCLCNSTALQTHINLNFKIDIKPFNAAERKEICRKCLKRFNKANNLGIKQLLEPRFNPEHYNLPPVQYSCANECGAKVNRKRKLCKQCMTASSLLVRYEIVAGKFCKGCHRPLDLYLNWTNVKDYYCDKCLRAIILEHEKNPAKTGGKT